jgi:hypothetical protein
VARHKRRWSVIYEGDVGSAWEWCQIKLHISCDVPAPLHHLKTTVVDDARSIFAPTVVSCPDPSGTSQKALECYMHCKPNNNTILQWHHREYHM